MQQARESNSRGSIRNPNYVQITNLSGRRLIKRRLAEHWIKCGRAKEIGPGQIQLLNAPDATASGYDDVDNKKNGCEFQMKPGASGPYTVMKFERISRR